MFVSATAVFRAVVSEYPENPDSMFIKERQHLELSGHDKP
jgi:hypothetical protein